jgi:toxin ParE1/3/4
MAEIERKEVKISRQFELDIISLYTYGEEVFGTIAAKSFIADIYHRVWSLDNMYLLHLECRHLPTKDKRYHNIILGSYLIIYRITTERIEVLRILHSHSSITKIKSTRQIKPWHFEKVSNYLIKMMIGEITLEDGVWIGAKATVCPGVSCKSHSILSVASVANKDMEAYGIYQGNPAVKVKERVMEHG